MRKSLIVWYRCRAGGWPLAGNLYIAVNIPMQRPLQIMVTFCKL